MQTSTLLRGPDENRNLQGVLVSSSFFPPIPETGIIPAPKFSPPTRFGPVPGIVALPKFSFSPPNRFGPVPGITPAPPFPPRVAPASSPGKAPPTPAVPSIPKV